MLTVPLLALLALLTPPPGDCPPLEDLYGAIEIVESFADCRVQVVTSFPDLRVDVVESFADGPGKWTFVESFPDYTITYVESFPDVKVQFVDAFPGVVE